MSIEIEPRTLTGFMELLPNEEILFEKIKDVIRKNYEKFGFVTLDTQIVDLAEVLLTKAGGYTYRFTKGDNYFALRFDLTVPLAKYVAKIFSKLHHHFSELVPNYCQY